MTPLYDSDSMHRAIKKVLQKSSAGDRRVAVVAYVGDAAGDFLPDPDGLEIVCCLKPMTTSHWALERLQKRGAKLYHAPDLHAKVYWSNSHGCVVGSANASGSALGRGGLKEAGVLVASSEFDIDVLLERVGKRPIEKADLAKLARATDRLAPSFPIAEESRQRTPFTFGEWHSSLERKQVKLGPLSDSVGAATASKAKAKSSYGISAPFDWRNCSKAQFKNGDWVLSFHLDHDDRVSDVHWQFVDFVVEVKKSDTAVFEKNSPFQACQAFGRHRYPYPPFDIRGQKFRQALQSAVRTTGGSDWLDRKSMVVTPALISLLAERLLVRS